MIGRRSETPSSIEHLDFKAKGERDAKGLDRVIKLRRRHDSNPKTSSGKPLQEPGRPVQIMGRKFGT